MPFRSLPVELDGPVLLEPDVHGDARGFFAETWRADELPEPGVPDAFVQDNHSRSTAGVVRGMHLQIGDGIAKLVRCARGAILDVVVDVRHGSPTFGRWEGVELSDENMRQLYVPAGFGHGFCVLSDLADVLYKQTGYYAPDLERGFAYDDPDVGIAWPEMELRASPRDASAPRLAEIADELPFRYG